jgi:hypothetical protein
MQTEEVTEQTPIITEKREHKFKVATLTRNVTLESEQTITFKSNQTTADSLHLVKKLQNGELNLKD